MILRNNIIANYAGKLYTILIGIVVLPFYLELLGAEAYGLVGFFVLMQSWMALLDIGMSPTLSREVATLNGEETPQAKERFKALLHSLESIFIVLSLVVALGIILFSGWISHHWLKVESLDLSTVKYSIVLMGIMIGIRFVSALYKSGIAGAENQVWLNVTNVIMATLKFVGVLFILYFISTNVTYFFEYQMFVSVLELLVFVKKFYKIVEIEKFKFYFSYSAIKPIIPFAGGIALTSAIWIFMTQLDKLLLSTILPLDKYGYFVIVAMVANAIMQLVDPISQAILPRMSKLYTQNRHDEMIDIYKKSTQLMALFIFSVVGMVAGFSYELLYAWTGNKEVSLWSQDILFWYVLGNGITAISAFQYYLQFAHGKLKMHVQYNLILALIAIPLISWSAYTYGAIGVALSWFSLSLLSFLVWVPLVHHIFAPHLHKDWILKDILPIFISTVLFIGCVKYMDFDFNQSRLMIFVILLCLGILLLVLNTLVSSEGRAILFSMLHRYKKIIYR